MKAMLPDHKRSRPASLLLYGLGLSLVMLAPILGVMAAGFAFWQALQAGSIWYMPLGVVLALAAIAMVHSHRPFDLALLGLVTFAMLAWFGADSRQHEQLLDAIQALALQTHLMAGVLLVMILALVLLHAIRRFGSPAAWPRLIWIGLPVIVLLSIGAAASDGVIGIL